MQERSACVSQLLQSALKNRTKNTKKKKLLRAVKKYMAAANKTSVDVAVLSEPDSILTLEEQ